MSASRCPQCAAAVRPDARWCSLCHAALGADPRLDSTTSPSPADPAEPLTSSGDDAQVLAATRGRGRHAKGRPVSADIATASDVDIDRMAMAILGGAVESPEQLEQLSMFDDVVDIERIDLSALADRPVVSGRWNDLASRLDSNAAKAALMAGIAVGMSVLIFGFLTLVGILFT